MNGIGRCAMHAGLQKIVIINPPNLFNNTRIFNKKSYRGQCTFLKVHKNTGHTHAQDVRGDGGGDHTTI